jgi:biopolymer transport protein ExbB
MNLDFLRTVALTGGDWVLWALLLSSVLSIGIIVERYWILAIERKRLNLLTEQTSKLIEENNFAEAAARTKKLDCVAAQVLMSALRYAQTGVESMHERVAIARAKAKYALGRRLLFLGTLGSNAPFIGLFGTVLGVIKAFHDLAGSKEGADAAMAGLSEALIATAVGLIVAIPALMAFNFLNKRVGDIEADTDSLVQLVTSRITLEQPGKSGAQEK